MPTYDYVCEACGHALEIFHSMTEAAKKKCPKCGKSKLVRQLGTGAGILFKGSGFYQTDYRSEGYKKAADADKPAESNDGDKGKSSSDAKSDSKSDAKIETKPAAKDASTKPDKPAPAISKADHAPKEKPKARKKDSGS